MSTQSFITVNTTAFVTSALFATGTIACTVGAVVVSGIALPIILGVGAAIFAGLSIASMTAFFDTSSQMPNQYLKNVGKHAGYTVTATIQFVAQTIFVSLINGIANAIGIKVQRKILGRS